MKSADKYKKGNNSRKKRMNLYKFITFVSIFVNLAGVNNGYALEITEECSFNRDYENYRIEIKSVKKSANWYEKSTKADQLLFTEQKDCEDTLFKLKNSNPVSEQVHCSCYASAYAPALFWGNLWMGFDRINCIKVENSLYVTSLLKTKEVIRNGWEKLSEKQIREAELENYFDRDDRLGRNHLLCKQLLPEVKKSFN